jgi:RimJ/RimL family protein N-acetyltransferase
LGESAYSARIQIESSLQQNEPIDIINFWSSLARVGVGRNLTIFLQIEPEGLGDPVKKIATPYRKYKCLPREKITLGNYSIETVQDDDIESIRSWRNSQMDVLRQTKPISVEEQSNYFQHVIWPSLTDPNPGNILFRYLKDEKLIGYGGLVHITWKHKRAEVSFLLDPSLAADKDTYANCYSNFLSLLKELSFEDLGFKRLFTETFAIRKHHISILESNGFRVEGVLKNHVYMDEKPVDSIIHGFLSSYNE